MKRIIFITILALIFSFSAFARNENASCPVIEVIGGGVVRPGEPISFTANVRDKIKNSNFEYDWSVTQGTILSGQGTASITVETTGLLDISLTATAKIKGLPENCTNVFSESVSVSDGCRLPILLDEFGKLFNNEANARIRALYARLGNELNSQGYIINYGTDEEIAAREKQIQKAINLLKLDPGRVTIVRGGSNPNGEGVWTKIWVAPLGTDNPQP